MTSEVRQYLNECRGRCEGLNDSIRLGLRRLRVNTTVEDSAVDTATVAEMLSAVEDMLRRTDRVLWQTLDRLDIKG